MSIRENNKFKTWEKLVSTARHLFRSAGYNETMMTEIAAEAEISIATLYNYFPTKQSLLIGIAKDQLRQLKEMLDLEVESHKPADVRIRDLMILHVVDSISYLSLARRIAFTLSDNEYNDDLSNDIRNILIILIDEGKNEGIFRKDVDTKEMANLMNSIYYSVLFGETGIEKLSTEDCKKAIDKYLSFIIQMMKK